MSATYWVLTVVEILLIVLVVIGFVYEPDIAKWEKKQKEKVLKALKERKALRK